MDILTKDKNFVSGEITPKIQKMAEALQGVSKANYQTSSSDAVTGQIGVKVEPQLIDINPAKDFLVRRWRNKEVTNLQLSANYSTLDSVSFVSANNPFFQEGKCPPSIQYGTDLKSKVKKHFGVEGGMTNASLVALNGSCGVQGINGVLLDSYDRHLRILDARFRNALEWAVVNGDTNSDSNAFNGLDKEITADNGSLVVDLGGTSIQREDINQIISVQSLRGVSPTAIVGNPVMINAIKELYYTGGVTNDSQYDPFGFLTIPTPTGNVSLVGTPAVGVTYASGDAYTSDVYILAEEYDGESLLYMDYLIPETILPNELFSNGTNCTSTTFGIYAVGTLVNRAPVAQAKIENAGFSINGALNTVVTALSGNGVVI